MKCYVPRVSAVPRCGVLLAVVWVLALVPATVEARVLTVADQNARTFTDPIWQSLELEHTRANVAWDIATGVPDTRTVAMLDAAQAAGVDVLVTWTPSGLASRPKRNSRARSWPSGSAGRGSASSRPGTSRTSAARRPTTDPRWWRATTR